MESAHTKSILLILSLLFALCSSISEAQVVPGSTVGQAAESSSNRAAVSRSAARVFQINAGLNDAWVDSDIPGQGFFITVLPDLGLMFLAWFTYETERPDDLISAILGEPGHRWLTALGPYDGDTATLNIEVTSGGVFNSSTPVPTQTMDGTITVEFADCANALLTFNIPSIPEQGQSPLTRAVGDNIARCEEEQPAEPVVISYIGNLGVMLQHADQEVIIDGLLGNVGGWIAPVAAEQNKILTGAAPYQDIEVAGFTHGHGDHVSFTPVNTFLSNQANTVFIGASTEGVGSINDQGRVQLANMPRGQNAKFNINGVPVTIFHTRHFNQFGNDFSSVTNLAYLVELAGKKILHVGDFDYAADNIQSLGLLPGELDVIIMPTFNTLISQANFDLITNMLAPKLIIAAHFRSGSLAAERAQVLSLLPNAVIFDTPTEQIEVN